MSFQRREKKNRPLCLSLHGFLSALSALGRLGVLLSLPFVDESGAATEHPARETRGYQRQSITACNKGHLQPNGILHVAFVIAMVCCRVGSLFLQSSALHAFPPPHPTTADGTTLHTQASTSYSLHSSVCCNAPGRHVSNFASEEPSD